MNGYSDEAIAQVMRAVVRELQKLNGEQVVSAWEDRPPEEKAASAEGIRKLRVRNLSPRAAHEEWMATRLAEGWAYGPVKDYEKKQSPLLVPYEELDFAQRVKDELYAAIIPVLTGARPQ